MPSRLANLWDDERARSLSEPERLLYRSNLLGSDLRITNFGGGNTSAKVMQRDPLTGLEVEVLWVKGSGGDLGSVKLDGFATLYTTRLEQPKPLYRGLAHEDEMVGYLPHCTFGLNPRAGSGSWKAERAAANKIGTDEVEGFYRKRSLLQRSVYPEDVAEAVTFFASEASTKSTGNILNVDAGNAVAFTR